MMLIYIPLTCFPNRRALPFEMWSPPDHTSQSCERKSKFSHTRAQQGDELVGESDGAIGHVVVPLQLPATVLRLVELLHLRVEDVNSWTKCSNVSLAQQYDCRSHLWNKVFKLSWQSDWDSFTGSSPGSNVEDFY